MDALDEVRRETWNQVRSPQRRGRPAVGAGKKIKDARWTLRKNPEHHTDTQRDQLAYIAATDPVLDDMAGLLGDPEVMRFYPRVRDRAEALQWIQWNQRLYQERGSGLWLMTLRETGEFVGDCGITPQDVGGRTEIEIGCHVRADLQGHGYATEAAAVCRDHAQDVCGVRRLIAIINPDNVASQRVAQKIGLGYERDAEYGGGVQRIYAADLAPRRHGSQ